MEARYKALERAVASKQAQQQRRLKDLERQYDDDVAKGLHEPTDIKPSMGAPLPAFSAAASPNCSTTSSNNNNNNVPRTRSPTRTPGDSGDIVLALPSLTGYAINVPPTPAAIAAAASLVMEGSDSKDGSKEDDLQAFMAQLQRNLDITAAQKKAHQRNARSGSGRFTEGDKLNISFPAVVSQPPMCTPYRHKPSMYRTELPHSIHPAIYKSSNTDTRNHDFFISTIHAVPRVVSSTSPGAVESSNDITPMDSLASTARSLPPTPLHHQQSASLHTPTLPSPPLSATVDPTSLSRIDIPLSLTQVELITHIRTIVMNTIPDGDNNKPNTTRDNGRGSGSDDPIKLDGTPLPSATLNWYEVLPCTTLPYTHIERRKLRLKELMTTALSTVQQGVSSGWSRKSISSAVVEALRDDLADWKRCADDELIFSPHPPFAAGFVSKTVEDGVSKTSGDVLRDVLSQLKHQHDGLFGEKQRHHSGYILRRIPADVKRGIVEGVSWEGAHNPTHIPGALREDLFSNTSFQGSTNVSFSMASIGGRVWNDVPMSGLIPESGAAIPTMSTLTNGTTSKANPLPPSAITNIQMLKKAIVVLTWFFVCVSRREQLQLELLVLSRRLCDTPPQYAALLDEEATLESPKVDISNGTSPASMSPTNSALKGQSGSPPLSPERKKSRGVVLNLSNSNLQRPRPSKRNASTRKTRSATIGVGLVELSAITQEMMVEDGNNSSRTNGSDDSGSESALPVREDNTARQMAGIRGQISEYMRMEEAMFNGLGDILGKSLQHTLTGRGDPSVADSKPSTLLTSGFEGRVARDEFLDVIPLLLTYCVRYALAESFPDVDHRHEDDVAEQRDLEREQEADRAKRHRHDADSKKSMTFKTGKGGLKRRALWMDPRFATTRKSEPVTDAAGVLYFSPPPVCVPEVFGEEDYRGDHQHLAVGANSRAAKAMEGLDTWDQLVYSARNTALSIEFTHRIFRQITMWLTGVDPHMSAIEAAKCAFETQKGLEERLLTKDGVSAHLLSTEEEEYLDGAGGMGKRRKSVNLSSGGFLSNDYTDKEDSRDQRSGGGGGAPTSRKQSDMIAAALIPEAFPHPCMASDQSKVVQFRPTGFDTGGFGGSVDLGTTTPAFMTEFGEEVVVSSNKSPPSAREKALQYDAGRKAKRMEQARTLTTTTSKRWEDHSQCRTVVSTRQESGSSVLPTWQFQAPAWSVVHADCLQDLMSDPLEESGFVHKPVALRQHLIELFMVPHPIYGYTQHEQEVIANMPAFQDRAETSADVEVGQGSRVTQKYSAHRSPLVLLYLHRFGPVTTAATVILPIIPPTNQLHTNRDGGGAKSARRPSVRSVAPPLPPVSSARSFKTSKDGATSVVSHNFSSIAREHEIRAEKMIEEGVKEYKAFRQRENVILQQTTENRKHRDRLIAYSKAMVQYSRSPRNPEKVRMARKIEVTLKNALRVHTQWCKVGQYLTGHLDDLTPTDPFAPPTYECDLNATNDVDAFIIKHLPHYLITRRPLDKLDVVRALQFACGLYEAEIQTMTCDSLIRDRLTKLWSECAGRRRNLQRDPLMERCDVSKELQAALSPGTALPPLPTAPTASRQDPQPKDKWVLEQPSQNGVICSPPSALKEALNDHQEQVKRDHWSLVQYTERDNAFQLDLSKTEASPHGDDYLHALSERLVAKTGFQGNSVDTVVIGKSLVEALESKGKAIDPPPPAHVRTPPCSPTRSPTTSTRQGSRHGSDAKRFSSSKAASRSSKTDEEPKTVYWERQQAELRQQRALERLKYMHEMDHMNLEVDLFIAQNSGAKKVVVDEDLLDEVEMVEQEKKSCPNGELSVLEATGSFGGSCYSPTHGMLLDAVNVVSRPQSLLGNPVSPLIPSPPPHGRSPRRPSVPQEFQSTHEQVQRRLNEIIILDKTKRELKVKEDKSKEVPLLESLLRPEDQQASSFSMSRRSPSAQSPTQPPRSAVSPPRSAVNIDSAMLLKPHARSEDPSQCRSVEEVFFFEDDAIESQPQQLHNDDTAVVRRESSVRRRSRSSTITDQSRMVVQSITLASALKAQQDCLDEVIRSSEPVYEELGMPAPSALFEDNEGPPVRALSGLHQGGGQLPPRPSIPDTREGSRLTTPFKGSRATHPIQRRETPTEDGTPNGGGHRRPSDVTTTAAMSTNSN